jgi:glycogen synthase
MNSRLGVYKLQESESLPELLFSYLQFRQSDVKRGSFFKLTVMTINIINTVIESISNGISNPLSVAHL